MKTKIQKITYFPFVLLLFVSFGCENNSGQLEILNSENTELRDNYQKQLLETRLVTMEADSLKTVVNKFQRQINKLSGEVPAYKATSKDEAAIEALVNNLHHAWASMVKSKDTNDLLQYFLPKFTTTTVRINTENMPSVSRKNDANFREHLQELINVNKISIAFGQTKFLYTEVKNDFFVTSYKTRLRVYLDNKQIHTSSMVTQLAGENKDGWKVGNYNWVTINYE